jgi:opacity protein-like surface antigen
MVELAAFATAYETLMLARVRVGYAMGNAMPYLPLGAARTNIGEAGFPKNGETGFAYALGVDVQIGADTSFRVEYGGARFDDALQPAPFSIDAEYEALTLAWHF